MLHFVAHHALTRMQQGHVLFQARDIQFQRLKSDRQPLVAEVEVLPGILGVVKQLMRRRTQSEERCIGIGGINKLADRLFK